MLLSGGEKALTAISLLFAIQQLNPAPFCILDEIEAALDDANVVRFASYLKELCDRTQFIVITHRKMCIRDRMSSIYYRAQYGVDSPRVGLLNVGAEGGKGNALTKEVYPMLREETALNFAGNVEARDLFAGAVEIAVCDGFAGNILLKDVYKRQSLGCVRGSPGSNPPDYEAAEFDRGGGCGAGTESVE